MARRVGCSWVSTCNAIQEATRLGRNDSAVTQGSKWALAHRSNASMPTKCMDQTPPPSATAPEATVRLRRKRSGARKASAARCSAMREEAIASATDRATSQGSCPQRFC